MFSSLLGNSQKLDGGAMFGNAPQALWRRWEQPDEHNRIDLACRALLLESGDHKVLFESGIGCYMEPKFKQRYGVVEQHHVLLESLGDLGLSHEDITEVVLSHLHFDHAGGLLSAWQEGTPAKLLFPKARFYVGRGAWERALNPHPRDRASFIPELNQQLEASGRLRVLDPGETLRFGEVDLQFVISSGHTPGMMCSDLRWQGKRMVFAADLIPGRHWVHLPITMGYDRYPEQLIDEKRNLLTSLVADDGLLFFTHDHQVAAARVHLDEQKNKYSVGNGLSAFTRSNLEQLA